MSADPAAPETHGLARRLTLFDATMLVMGGIIGSGIFVTPAEVARHVGTPYLIVGVWILGGAVFALAGDSAVPPRRSAVHLGPEFVVTNSLTKVYGLSGLRCGWILAEAELAERVWRLNDLFGVNQAHQAERLACIAFDHIDEVAGDTAAMLEQNRVLFDEFVRSRGDLECPPAEHGITAFPRWRGGDTQRLDDHLRSRYDTAIVAGRWFEMPDHFRIGFGLPTAEFKQALNRLQSALDDL